MKELNKKKKGPDLGFRIHDLVGAGERKIEIEWHWTVDPFKGAAGSRSRKHTIESARCSLMSDSLQLHGL